MNEGKTCKICSKTFTRRNYLLTHIEKIHSKRYSCPTCLRYFPGPTKHSCATENGRFVCYVEKCSLRFANGLSLRLHVRDGHTKVDENMMSGAGLKTKKAARDMVKMLCKKINVLSKCFDELRYQMNNVTEFLKSIGYESQLRQIVQKTEENEEADEENENYDNDNIDDYIDYIEEEPTVDASDDEMYAEQCDEFINVKAENNPTLTFQPSTETQRAVASVDNSVKPVKISSFNPHKPLPTNDLFNMQPVVRRGSTVIRQLPFKIVPLQGQNIKLIKAATVTSQVEATSNTAEGGEKSTIPPLFLKIQYDNETEICKTDPKITFSFDTRPLDNNSDESKFPT